MIEVPGTQSSLRGVGGRRGDERAMHAKRNADGPLLGLGLRRQTRKKNEQDTECSSLHRAR